jgi:hypothetical protein
MYKQTRIVARFGGVDIKIVYPRLCGEIETEFEDCVRCECGVHIKNNAGI